MKRLEELTLLAGRQVAPLADAEALYRDRPDSRPPQSLHLDPGDLHDPSHQVVDPLVNGDREDNAVRRFAEQAHLFRHDPPPVDDDPVPDPRELRGGRPRVRQDVILLGQPVPRMHDPVGDIAVIGEEQQTLGLAVEPTDREDALGDVHEVHHGPATALIAHRRDVAGRLVQDQVAQRLRRQELPIDADLVVNRIGLRPQLGHDLAVDRNSPFPDQPLGRAARSDSSRGEDALQSFQAELLNGARAC